jgi:hypothetical protein
MTPCISKPPTTLELAASSLKLFAYVYMWEPGAKGVRKSQNSDSRLEKCRDLGIPAPSGAGAINQTVLEWGDLSPLG